MRRYKYQPVPRTLSIPEAGQAYYGLGLKASYKAAKRGDIPYVLVGRLKRVPIEAMEAKLQKLAVPA